MTRKSYTTRQRVMLFEAHGGKCWRCGLPITIKDEWELGHCGRAYWLDGHEVAPEHKRCNREDAKEQTKAAAKSVRIRAKAYGIKRTKHIVPGSKASPWKKKLDGTVVRRDEQ